MPQWDARWLNPFVEKAFSVLASFGLHAERDGALSVERADETTDPVTVIVAVVGDLEGAVLYGLDASTAEALAAAMIGDLPRVRWDHQLIESALGEFGNMVTGQASIELETLGWRCTIAPPLIALEPRLILSDHRFDRVVVPIRTSAGPMRIRLALRPRSVAGAAPEGDRGRGG
jgi:chemotaxis protein CheX